MIPPTFGVSERAVAVLPVSYTLYRRRILHGRCVCGYRHPPCKLHPVPDRERAVCVPGLAANEIQEECDFVIKEAELVDLTGVYGQPCL